MKKTVAIIFFAPLFLNSCHQNKTSDKIPVVGEAIDSIAIAQDTIEQKIMESSYEYAQTLIVSPKLAYDVRAYGGPPSYGEYCIIRRGADNKPDTVVEAERFGVIVNAFTADLNKNGKEEVYVVMRRTHHNASSYVTAFEFDKNGKASPLVFGDSSKTFTINTPVPYDTIRPNSDTIFTQTDMLMKYYAHDENYSPDQLNHAWKLRGRNFELMHND